MLKQALLFLLVFAATTVQSQSIPIQIIPQPVVVLPTAGTFTVTASTTIGVNRFDSRYLAEMLADRLQGAMGFRLKTQLGSSSIIQLNLNDKPDITIGQEGYTLKVTDKGVVISANQMGGLFYGIQTLIQLFPKSVESKTVVQEKWTLPGVEITDYPRFRWRGIMLDVSRHFFTKESVKTYIDQIARLKYNTFHWHLTDDNGWRVEIKSLPKLTQVGAWRVPRTGHFGDRAEPLPGEKPTYGGYYTHEDIKEVVRYAQERNVTIVPEIDVPGHSMAALAAYPELSCTKNPNIKVDPGTKFAEWFDDGTFKMFVDNTLNPSDENVYVFLDNVFTELAFLFPGPYIHAGGDECYKGFWKDDAGCQALMKKLNLTHLEELQGYFMKRVGEIIESKGKRMLGWDEILEGGISPGAMVMSWRGTKGGIEAAEKGHEVVMAPTTFAYLDYVQGDPTIDPPIYASLRAKKSYSFEPVPEGVDPKFILGGQGNLWTEQIPTLRYAEYMTYPRAWALSEVYWSPKEVRNWDNFVKRMETHFERSDYAGINYAKSVYDAIITVKKEGDMTMIVLESEVPGLDIFFTLDDTMPDHKSTKYTAPMALPDGPVTLRVITYRNGKPLGHLITLTREKLLQRIGN